MILFQVTVGLNAAQTDTGAIQALVGGVPGGQANVTAGANTLSFTLAWDETLDGDFPSSLSFQFTGAGGNSLTFTSISINGQSVSLGTYLDNATINSGTQNGTLTLGAPIRHFFGRQEPDVGDPADIRANPGNILNTDLAQPGDTVGDAIIVANAPQVAAIEGSSGRDIIYGSDFADRINAGDGDDSVAGNNGGDTLFGGSGNDMIAGGAGDDSIFGGTGDDLLFGNAGADLILGQGGNNVLNGGDGDDTLVGGANNDIIFGGADEDTITGGNGNDALYGDDAADILSGGNGEDTGWGGAGNDTLSGGNGNDTLYGDADDDMLSGGAGNDVLYGDDGTGVSADGADIMMGGAGNDRVYGGLGNDVLLGEAGDDTLQGQDGDDVLIGGAGADTLDGGDGADILYGTSIDTAAATALVAQGGRPDVSFGMAGNSFYKVVLGSFDYTTAAAAAAADTLNGVAGHLVVITSAAEQATVNELVAAAGGTGQFWMGGSDNAQETVWSWQGGIEASRWFSDNSGTSISNFFTYWQGGAPGAEDYQALNADNNGYWTANASTATFGYIIEWDATSMSADTGADIMVGGADDDILYGSAGDKTIDGGDGGDQIFAIAGNNVLIGGAGNDLIVGGSGNDTMRGDAGNDAFDGGSGVDTYDASAATAGMSMVNFLSVMAVLNDGYGATTELLANVENITGTAFNDTIEGNYIDNVLIGGGGTDLLTYANATGGVTVNLATTTAQNTGTTGTDTVSGFENLTGSAFNDTLTGDSGANVIDGGNGNDTIDGGAGNDTMIGGGGTDLLTYANATAAVTVSLATTTAQNTGGAGTDTVSGFENLTGSSFADTLTGDGGNNVIRAGAGQDAINGGAGIDTYDATDATGSVVVVNFFGAMLALSDGFGAVTEVLANMENVTGGVFNDTIEGNYGGNVLAGAGGTDLLTYANSTAGVTVSLATTMAQNTGGAGTDTVSGFENLTGSGLNDTLTGDSGANVIDGGAGNDVIDGGAGNDTLFGGAGTDTLTGGAGDDVIHPGSTAGAGNTKVVDGGTGVDTIDFSDITPTGGHSVYIAWLGVSYVLDDGFGSDPYILSNFENVTGSSVNDILDLARDTVDSIVAGGLGNDTLSGGGGSNTLDGGSGNDTASYGNTFGVTTGIVANLALGTGQVTNNGAYGGSGVDTLVGIEQLIGSAYNDTITGSSGNDILSGGAGNDTIDAGAGDDTVDGGTGNDILTGGSGTDTVGYGSVAGAVTFNLATTTAQNTGSGGTDTVSGFENITGSNSADTLTGNSNANTINGGGGNDTLIGAAGNDYLDGGAGTADIASYSTSTAGVTVNLTTGTASDGLGGTDTLVNIEGILGSAQADVLTGSAGNDIFSFSLGNDGIDGGAGTNTYDLSTAPGGVTVGYFGSIYLSAYSGHVTFLTNIQNINGSGFNDVIEGTTGNNVMTGGAGTDTLTYTTSTYDATAGVTVNLATTTAQNTGGAGTDTVSGFENLTGSGFADTLTGTTGANVVDGGANNDVLHGNGGNDVLTGGAGSDTIYSDSTAATTVAAILSANAGIGLQYLTQTGNFYRYISSGAGPFTYANANTEAGSAQLSGVSGTAGDGHVITINSATEFNFVANTINISGAIWLGIGDQAAVDTYGGGGGVEGTWKYLDGPETGITFYTGSAARLGYYVNTSNFSGAMNDTTNDYALMRTGTDVWAHQDGGEGNHRIIEWDGQLVFNGVTKDTVTLDGGAGADTLYGDDGKDIFLFMAATAGTGANADAIYNFNASVDVLDLSNLLTGYTSGTSNPNDFVFFKTVGGDTEVKVDTNGGGGMVEGNYATYATIIGLTGIDVDDWAHRGILDMS